MSAFDIGTWILCPTVRSELSWSKFLLVELSEETCSEDLMFKLTPLAPIILLMACPAPKQAVDECQQNQPYALSLKFTDINGDAFQPLHIEYSASNGESGSAEQTSDGSWTIEADAYGEIEVIVTHESGEETIDFTVLYDNCNHPIPQEHTVALDVNPCNEGVYTSYHFFFKEKQRGQCRCG